MRNLLTPKLKKHLKMEYRLRLLAVLLFLFSAAVFMGGILLIPSLVLSEAHKNSAEEEARLVKQSLIQREDASLSRTLERARTELEVIEIVQGQPLISKSVERILKSKPDSISINTLSFSQDGSSSDMVIGLSGVARTREGLLSFERVLKNDPSFASVVLPVSNLAQDRNISFSLTIIER